MKKILCLFGLLTVCACVYDVPLVEKAVIPVDPQLAGIWQLIPEEGKEPDPDERMNIVPFSQTEYVVIFSRGNGEIIFRAYLIDVEDVRMIQLECLGADDDRYHVCRYSLADGVLAVEMVNNDVVRSDIKDSAALREALLANRDNPGLFDSPDRYRRVED